MLCPACTTERLTIAERLGVEIDYCPKCRGVWLDRGELDKLIVISSTREAHGVPGRLDDGGFMQGAPRRQRGLHEEPDYDRRGYEDRRRDYDDDDDDDRGRGRGGRRRGSFLGDIFDFD